MQPPIVPNPDPGNVRYYQVLGLSRTDATPADIKKGYKKMSLKYHPDRNQNDPESTTKFQEVSHAYGVLSSARLRQVYDSYGDQGLKMYESYMSFAESEDGSALPIGPVMMLLLVCFAITLVIGLVTAFGVMLLLRLDDNITPSLAVLLIPLWIIDGLVCSCLVAGFALSRSRAVSLAMILAQLVAVVAFQVLLCMRLDEMLAISYSVVFTPLFVLEAVLAARSIVRGQPSAWDGERATGNTLLSYPLFVLRAFGWVAVRGSVLILMALRLDATLDISWTIVLVPLWFLLVLEFCLGVVAMRSDSPSDRGPVLRQLAGTRVIFTIFLSVVLLLLCLRLDQGSVAWISIFWPLFVVSGIYFCCCCCLCCALSIAPRPEARDVPPAEGGDGFGKGGYSSGNTSGTSSTASTFRKTEEAPLLAGTLHGNYGMGGNVVPMASHAAPADTV